MKILVDADSCSKIGNIEKIASTAGIDVELYCNYCTELESSYSTLVMCDISADAADFALINSCTRGDIVVTSDIGLAAMAMAKGAKVIKNSGQICTYRSMGYDLNKRAVFMKTKRAGKRVTDISKANRALHGSTKRFSFNSGLKRLIRLGAAQA